MYNALVAESPEPKNLRIVLPFELVQPWEELLERKNISQQVAMVELIKFVLDKSDVVQSVILGQMQADHDIIATILKRKPK